jgi:hypothetical protein
MHIKANFILQKLNNTNDNYQTTFNNTNVN